MSPERLDRVQVATSRRTVALPWASRDDLLAQMRHLESMRPVVQAFEAVGASRPVRLTLEQKRELLTVLELWMQQVGVRELPEGVFDLRNALHDDLTTLSSGRRRAPARTGRALLLAFVALAHCRGLKPLEAVFRRALEPARQRSAYYE